GSLKQSASSGSLGGSHRAAAPPTQNPASGAQNLGAGEELGEIKDSLGGKADKAHPAAPGIARIDHSILIGKDSTQVRSLVGVSSHYSLEKLYEFLDPKGAATHMVFYDKREGSGLKQTGEKVSHRNGVFRGINGLFLTLMVLRTAVPLVVASTLFGVHETTVGRAFTTWLNF
ncbi:unnamed protein product, partial [Pylaiella littoralis]